MNIASIFGALLLLIHMAQRSFSARDVILTVMPPSYGGQQGLIRMTQVNQMLSGERFDYQCHSNLTRAILPYGLTEFDVHDVLNVFQVTGLNINGQYFM